MRILLSLLIVFSLSVLTSLFSYEEAKSVEAKVVAKIEGKVKKSKKEKADDLYEGTKAKGKVNSTEAIGDYEEVLKMDPDHKGAVEGLKEHHMKLANCDQLLPFSKSFLSQIDE